MRQGETTGSHVTIEHTGSQSSASAGIPQFQTPEIIMSCTPGIIVSHTPTSQVLSKNISNQSVGLFQTPGPLGTRVVSPSVVGMSPFSASKLEPSLGDITGLDNI